MASALLIKGPAYTFRGGKSHRVELDSKLIAGGICITNAPVRKKLVGKAYCLLVGNTLNGEALCKGNEKGAMGCLMYRESSAAPVHGMKMDARAGGEICGRYAAFIWHFGK